jgi:FtsZ-binding cell division protein ZapB
MIDPSMDIVAPGSLMDNNDPPVSLIQAIEEIKILKSEIVDLTNKAAAATDNWEYARDRLQSRDRQVAELEDFLKDNHSDMDESHVEEIAGIFGISMTVDYDVTINVSFSGTITVPMGYDMDDLENDIQASITNGYYGNSDIEIDVSEDHLDIDYTEA